MGHLAGQDRSLAVGHRAGADNDPHLASGLHRERLLDSDERPPDPLQILQTTDIAFKHFPPRPGSGSGQRIRRIYQRSQYGFGLDFFVMGGNGVDDLCRLPVFASHITANDGV